MACRESSGFRTPAWIECVKQLPESHRIPKIHAGVATRARRHGRARRPAEHAGDHPEATLLSDGGLLQLDRYERQRGATRRGERKRARANPTPNTGLTICSPIKTYPIRRYRLTTTLQRRMRRRGRCLACRHRHDPRACRASAEMQPQPSPPPGEPTGGHSYVFDARSTERRRFRVMLQDLPARLQQPHDLIPNFMDRAAEPALYIFAAKPLLMNHRLFHQRFSRVSTATRTRALYALYLHYRPTPKRTKRGALHVRASAKRPLAVRPAVFVGTPLLGGGCSSGQLRRP